MIARSTFALFVFLLCSAATAVRADAAAPEPVRPMPSESVGLVVAAGVGGGVLAAGVSLGLGSMFAGGCGNDSDEDCEFLRSGVAYITAGVSMALGVPLLSASFATLAGRSHGYRGRMGHALLGSAAGFVLGAGLGLGTYFLVSTQVDGDLTPFLAGSGVAVLSSGIVAAVAYRASDAARARLAPSVVPVAGGATLGVFGRF